MTRIAILTVLFLTSITLTADADVHRVKSRVISGPARRVSVHRHSSSVGALRLRVVRQHSCPCGTDCACGDSCACGK